MFPFLGSSDEFLMALNERLGTESLSLFAGAIAVILAIMTGDCVAATRKSFFN